MTESITQTPEQQLAEFVSQQRVSIPKDLVLDGKPQRFGDGEKGREPHWYIGSKTVDGNITLTVGSHKDPALKATFNSKDLSGAFWRRGSNLDEKWASCKILGRSHYLEKKKIDGLFGARVNYFGNLVIPMYRNEILVGLQTITNDGKKLFVKGSKRKEAYFILESANLDITKIYVAEGFATAASVCMATKTMTICTFGASNLPDVVKVLKNKYKQVSIIIAGDDDRFGRINTGKKAAEKVSKEVKAIFPIFACDQDQPKDWNDLHIREGLETVRKQLQSVSNKPLGVQENEQDGNINTVSGWEIESAEPPAPENYVLPGLLRGDIGILCAPGGYGKSGVALLIANQIACGGQKDFLGFGPIESGACCYLTLEDPLSIFSQRQREIKQDFTTEEYLSINNNLHLIDGRKLQNSVDPNSIIEVIQNTLKKKGTNPDSLRLLIIDHLTYWSSKDLNDGFSCEEILQELKLIGKTLGCAVLILHHSNRSAMIKGKEKPSPGATIGGSLKLYSLARWVAFLGEVSPELKKEFKIRNERGYKTLVLGKVNHGKELILLLKHKEDRNGILYKFDFGDLNLQTISKTAPVEVEVVTKEEAENFNMGEASKKLMTLDDNTSHIMNWLSRNPAFETVSNKRRSELTDFVNGKFHDKDRPSASIHKDVWITGDTLIIAGPVCDQEDMKLFALLVNELTHSHRNGRRGLILDISLSQILTMSGLNISGPNFEKVHRQLDRLRRMSLDFQNFRGHRWRGPLINDVYSVGEGRNCKVRIGFNNFMVTFYRIEEYTMFNKSIALSLKGDSLSFYIFFASQNLPTMKISIEKCKKLLNISPSFDKKEALKKIKKSVQDLINAGVMDGEKTYIKDGNLNTYRVGL